MKSAVVDQSLSRIQYGGPFPQDDGSVMMQTALNYFIARRRWLLNVSFLLLLLSRKNNVIMHVPRSCRRPETPVGGTRYGTLILMLDIRKRSGYLEQHSLLF